MIEYSVTKSRRKTICIKVEPDGAVRVLAPNRANRAQIETFVNSNEAWIEKTLAKIKQRQEKYPPVSEGEKARLFEQAREYIPMRVAHFSAIMGVTPTSIKITHAERRWGSCSGRDGLCFSYRLMRYPQDAIDYVVVHELAHIKEKNHSSAFYDVVGAVLPDYKRRQALLK